MCCSGDSTAKQTETAQAAFTSTLTNAFKSTFANQQEILGSLTSKLTDMLNNPHGFDPKTLALMKTGASDTVARQTAAAQTAANAYLATSDSDWRRARRCRRHHAGLQRMASEQRVSKAVCQR